MLPNCTFSRDQLNYKQGGFKNVHYGDVLIRYPTFKNGTDLDIPFINGSESLPSKHVVLHDGDLVIADTAEDYTTGKAIELYNTTNQNILSGLHTIPCRPKLPFAPGYLGYYFNSVVMKRKQHPLIQGIKVYSLSRESLMSLSISYPSIREQYKIASLLLKIDERIEVQNKIIKDKKELKKGICEKKINNLQTELSLNDLIKKGYARTIKPSELLPFTGQKEYLSTSSINNNGISQVECKITYENRPSRACMFPMKNSVWFAKMKNTVKVFKSTDDDDEKYVLSTGFYGLLCEETKMNADWLYHLFKTNYFNDQKDRFSEGSSMSGIKDSQFNDIKIKIFENKLEEENFLSFLNLIDCSIQVEIRLLELFQNGKKYFLANLFI